MRTNTKLQIALDNLRRQGLKVDGMGEGREPRWTVLNPDGGSCLQDATTSDLLAYAAESAKRSILAEWKAEKPLG